MDPPPIYLASFFDRFPGFTYNHHNPSTDEFYRLCRFMGWPTHAPTRNSQSDHPTGLSEQTRNAWRGAWEDFLDAFIRQFTADYGNDPNDIRVWQALCETLGVLPVPDTLLAAREVCNTLYTSAWLT